MTPTINSTTPTTIFERKDYQIEIETAISLEKFQEQQKKDGKTEETATTRIQCLKHVAQKVNLNNPEEIKAWLANLIENKPCTWSNRTKTKFIDAYNAYLKFKDTKWNAPKYNFSQTLPFIPTEQEIDLLIAHCGKIVSTALQMLKETGIRIGELCRLQWIDLDTERKTISIRFPEKNSNSRILPISDKLIAMLNKLPKNHKENIFQPRKKALREYYSRQRKVISERLQNPKLKRITFHTFRHWKGTMEYHKTKDIIHVKTMLGHKSINSTMFYINIEQAIFLTETDEWTCKVAHNQQQAIQLIETGFEYLYTDTDGTKLFRKRK